MEVPKKGITSKAAFTRFPLEIPTMDSGKRSMLVMITSPVIAQQTTVSQKVAVIDMSACVVGGIELPAAVIPAVPSPASLVKSPLAIP